MGAGGGVAVYIKNNSAYEVTLAITHETHQKAQLVEIIVGGLRIFLCYRSPNMNYEEMAMTEQYIRSQDLSNSLVLGDLNLPYVNWDTVSASCHHQTTTCTTCRHQAGIAQALASHGLTNAVREATHQNGNSLDVVLTPDPSWITYLEVESEPSQRIADHYNIIVQATLPIKEVARFKSIPQYRQFDTFAYQHEILTHPWEEMVDRLWFNDEDALDFAASYFVQTITSLYKKFLPIKQIVLNTHYTGYRDRTLCQMQRVKRLHNTHAIETYEVEYARLKIMQAKEDERKRLDYLKYLKKNRNNIFKIMSKAEFERSITTLRRPDGTYATKEEEVGDMMNAYFASVLEKKEEFDVDPDDLEGAVCCEVAFDCETVARTIVKYKRSNGVGPDGISINMLKAAAHQIKYQLCMIFKTSFMNGKVPGIWLQSQVEALPKKGDCRILKNIRPICKESPVLKVFEKIIAATLEEKLAHVFPENQYGFTKKKGCEENLLDHFSWLSKKLNEGLNVDTVNVDFEKCFDKISHKVVIKVLFSYGIRGPLLRWIMAWFHFRTQYVKFGKYHSASIHVTSSVMQGSVLGPLLFKLVLSGLAQIPKHCVVFFFADDMRISLAFKTRQELALLYEDVRNMKQWCTDHHLFWNLSKCETTHYGPTNPRWSVRVSGINLPDKIEVRDLGLLVSTASGFAPHIEKLVIRVKLAATIAHRNLRNATFAYRSCIYTLYIQSIFSYSLSIIASKNLIGELDLVWFHFFEHQHLRDDEVLPLPPRLHLRLNDLCNIFRLYKLGKLNSIFGFDEKPNFQTTRAAISPHNIRLQKINIPIRKQEKLPLVNLLYREADEWNKLDEKLLNCSMVTFRKSVKEKLEDDALYINLQKKACKGVLCHFKSWVTTADQLSFDSA